MFSCCSFLGLLLFFFLAFRVAALPFDEGALLYRIDGFSIPYLLTHFNTTSLLLNTTSLGDWENFAYPIPNSKRILKGRIFTSRRISPSALHFAIDGGLAGTTSRISSLGDIRLADADNPYVYNVPGCHFRMDSKVLRGRAIMTYGMMRDVFEAFEEVLERKQRFFSTSFVLTDQDQRTWGHGEIFDRPPSLSMSET